MYARLRRTMVLPSRAWVSSLDASKKVLQTLAEAEFLVWLQMNHAEHLLHNRLDAQPTCFNSPNLTGIRLAVYVKQGSLLLADVVLSPATPAPYLPSQEIVRSTC